MQRLAFPQAVAIDLPGHRGEGPGRRRVEDYAVWLHAAAREREWLPAVLVGHSMGGAIALAFALSFPADLAAMVLIATGARLRVSPSILSGLTEDPAGTVDVLVRRFLSPGADARLVCRLKKAVLAVPADVVLGDFQACDAFDIRPRLGDIHVPALVIAAREDQMIPARYAEYLQARLARSSLVWIDNAGHMMHVERPREVNEAVRAFLYDLGIDTRR
jgi:pimeloyl-ACP methyl ester carboxylesterase